MSKYTTLLLDVDGTLLDFDKSELVALRNTYEHFNIDTSDENLNVYVNINRQLWIDFENKIVTKTELKESRFAFTIEKLNLNHLNGLEMNDYYSEELSKQVHFLEDALETVIELSKRFDLYIITNGNKDIQTRRMKDSTLDQYVIKSFISDDLGVQKPDIAYFNIVLKEVKEKDKSKILVVGDSLSSDIQGANNAGLDCVWINDKTYSGNLKIEATISMFKEIFMIL